MLIVVVSVLFSVIFPLMRFMGVDVTNVYPITEELNIIFFTFISFGLLGLYDDIMKFFKIDKSGFFGLRFRWKFAIQFILAFIVAVLLYNNLKIDIFYIPFIGVFQCFSGQIMAGGRGSFVIRSDIGGSRLTVRQSDGDCHYWRNICGRNRFVAIPTIVQKIQT